MHSKHAPQNHRVVLFDLLRVVLIVLIVNLHIRIITAGQSNFLEPLVWYAVPLFMVLSFYFMSKYFLQEKLSYARVFPRIKRLFIPLLFWSLMGFVVQPELLTIKNIFLQILTGEVVNVPLYFLNLLIFFTALFWLLTYVPLRLRFVIYYALVVVMFFLQYSLINYHFFSPMTEAVAKSYGRFAELFPYAVVGLFFGLITAKAKKQKIFLVLLLLLSVVLYGGMQSIPHPLDFHYAGLEIFFGTIFLFSLTILLSNVKFGSFLSKGIAAAGRYSFGVYLFHFILLQFLLKTIPYLKIYITASPMLFLISYVSFCYVFCVLIDTLTDRKFSFLIT